MILEDYGRYVIECDLELGRIPEDAPHMSLTQCLPYLLEMIDSGDAVYEFKKGEAVARILAYEIVPNETVTLLFQLADTNASDPAFAELDTGVSRVVRKGDGEGLAATAHLVISLESQTPAFPEIYSAVFEEVPGITRTLIGAVMTALFNEAVEFEFDRDRDGKHSRCKCRPRVSLLPLSAQDLSECLKGGWLLGFSAVRKVKDQTLDEEGDIKIEESRLVLKTQKSGAQRAIDLVKKAASIINKEGYTDLRVMYEDENKRKKSIPINPKRQDLQASVFIRSEYVHLPVKIEQCQSTIHPDLVKDMRVILNNR